MLRCSKIGLVTLVLAIGLAGAVLLHYWRQRDATAAQPALAISAPAQPHSQASAAQYETDSVDDSFPIVEISATDDQLLDLARNEVNRSPRAAIQWARSQADPILRRRLLSAVIHAWAEN